MDNYNKMFSQYEVYNIIDKKIKQEMEYKNRYIQLNGYKHKDILEIFDNRIAVLSELYKVLNRKSELWPYCITGFLFSPRYIGIFTPKITNTLRKI